MAQAFRLIVEQPFEKGHVAKKWEFSDGTGKVLSVDVELKKDKQRVSYLTAKLHDPKWSIFNELPDPAFSKVPVKLYLAPPNAARSPTVLVFDGLLTQMDAGYPGPTSLSLVAHDKSIELRRKAKYRTFHGKTSTQIAEAIAKEYGAEVILEVVGLTLRPSATDMGVSPSNAPGGLSDWDHLCRALAADGLEAHFEGKKLRIRQAATLVYPDFIEPGAPWVLSFQPSIKYVDVPGKGGDKEGPAATGAYAVSADSKVQALAGNASISVGAAEDAGLITDRQPVSGPSDDDAGSHTEDQNGSPHANSSKALARRKDTASLSTIGLPDLTLQHVMLAQRWGGKIDGYWTIESIKHQIVGSDFAKTTTSLIRGASPGAKKGKGLPAGGSSSGAFSVSGE